MTSALIGPALTALGAALHCYGHEARDLDRSRALVEAAVGCYLAGIACALATLAGLLT